MHFMSTNWIILFDGPAFCIRYSWMYMNLREHVCIYRYVKDVVMFISTDLFNFLLLHYTRTIYTYHISELTPS